MLKMQTRSDNSITDAWIENILHNCDAYIITTAETDFLYAQKKSTAPWQ